MITEERGLKELQQGVREVCAKFPNEYWRGLDARRECPEEFVAAMTEAGYLGALIPEEYGGMGLAVGPAAEEYPADVGDLLLVLLGLQVDDLPADSGRQHLPLCLRSPLAFS
jgi:alkylation response protein AidB-like acyl-CoA dehydrogenase